MTNSLTPYKEKFKKYEQYIKENWFPFWIATKHHRTHKNHRLDFSNHLYLQEIYKDKAKHMVLMASTQNGKTEYLLIRSIGESISGHDVFYVMPTTELINRFVKNRVDTSFQNTQYYRNLDRMVKADAVIKRSDSMKMKNLVNGTVAFVGSNSPAGFTEFPADIVIVDEWDRCDQDNLNMAVERLSHSDYRATLKSSNPTLEGMGIDNEFAATDQKYWYIKHDCGNWIKPNWFKHIVREENPEDYVIIDKDFDFASTEDIKMLCHKCGKPINRKAPGAWVKHNKASEVSGYQISKLYSGTVTIREIMDRFVKGQTNPTALQRFYNADLGLPFTSKGAKLSREFFARGSWKNGQNYGEGRTIAGIDVGNILNIVIGRIGDRGRLNVICATTCRTDYQELMKIIRKYKVDLLVIDEAPERAFVRNLKIKFKGAFSCEYASTPREPVDPVNKLIKVDRTATLDDVHSEIMTGTLIFPKDVDNIPDFMPQMEASTRVFNPAKNYGSGAYEWTEGSKADHYFHATNYLITCYKLLLMLR